MLITLTRKEQIDEKARASVGLFKQIILIDVVGLCVATVMLASFTKVNLLDYVGLTIAPIGFVLSLVTAAAALRRLMFHPLHVESAKEDRWTGRFDWRVSWACLLLALACLYLPIWPHLLMHLSIKMSLFISCVFFMAVGAFMSYQSDELPEAGEVA